MQDNTKKNFFRQFLLSYVLLYNGNTELTVFCQGAQVGGSTDFNLKISLLA